MDVTHHKLSSQELANYLQRIHLVSPPKATDIDGLKELQIHHLLSIPYENLDPMNGISTSMGVCQEFCVNRFNKQHRIAA